MPDPIRIQFVCLGNICRSPLAKTVFRDKVESAGLEEHFEIASSGTGSWHIGDTADDRMCETAQRNGLSLEDHRASQFEAEDLKRQVVAPGRLAHSVVRRVADVVAGGTGRNDFELILQPRRFHLVAEDGLGEGAPADVAEAHELDADRVGHSDRQHQRFGET